MTALRKNKLQSFAERHPYAIIFVCWLILQLLVFRQFGIVTGFEATKYIKEADNLLEHGNYSSGNFLFYSVQIFLIALSKATGSFPWLPVIVQLLINALSLLLFYRLCLKFTASVSGAVITCLVFLSMYFYHIYNTHLFTESIYYSLGIIYTFILFSMSRMSVKNAALIFLLLALVYFTRPTGVFFIPATIVFIVMRFYRKNAFLILGTLSLAGLALLYFLLNFALDSGGEFDFLLPYLDERIICGVPSIPVQHDISMPVEKNSVEGLWYIITHYPELFTRMAAKRFLAFWGMTRSFFSPAHNIFIAVYFYSIYALILWKLKNLLRLFGAETLYFLTVIFFVMVTVMLSCDEWHNRFILALLPFFLLMASARVKALNKNVHVNQPVDQS